LVFLVKVHWSIKYIGIPWVACGRSFEGFDCWGLVRQVYLDELSIKLPEYPIDPKKLVSVSKAMIIGLSDWVEIEKPEDNCLVVMSKTSSPSHVGVYILGSGGLVLHSVDGGSSVVDFMMDINQQFKLVKFYRHGSVCNNTKPI